MTKAIEQNREALGEIIRTVITDHESARRFIRGLRRAGFLFPLHMCPEDVEKDGEVVFDWEESRLLTQRRRELHLVWLKREENGLSYLEYATQLLGDDNRAEKE